MLEHQLLDILFIVIRPATQRQPFQPCCRTIAGPDQNRRRIVILEHMLPLHY